MHPEPNVVVYVAGLLVVCGCWMATLPPVMMSDPCVLAQGLAEQIHLKRPQTAVKLAHARFLSFLLRLHHRI